MIYLEILTIPYYISLHDRSNLLTQLTENERRYISQFNAHTLLFHAIGIVLLKRELAERFCVKTPEIVHTHKGKPVLSTQEHLFCSLSYSNPYIACAISNTHEIGIDIEVENPKNQIIAKRFYTPSESSYVTQDETLELHRFYEIWVKKESYLKMIGTGFHTPPFSFNVLDGESLVKSFFYPFPQIGPYQGCLCTRGLDTCIFNYTQFSSLLE